MFNFTHLKQVETGADTRSSFFTSSQYNTAQTIKSYVESSRELNQTGLK